MWPWTVNQVLYFFCYQRVRYFLLPFTESKRRRKWQPWSRKWQPTLVLLPRKFHGWRSLVGYSPWGRKESDTSEWLFTLALLKVRLRPFAFQFLRKMKARIDFEIILILYLFSFRMLLYLLLKSSVVIRHSYFTLKFMNRKIDSLCGREYIAQKQYEICKDHTLWTHMRYLSDVRFVHLGNFPFFFYWNTVDVQ